MSFAMLKSYGYVLLYFCERYGISNAFQTDEGLVKRSFDGLSILSDSVSATLLLNIRGCV